MSYRSINKAIDAVVNGANDEFPHAQRLFDFLSLKELKDTAQGLLAELFCKKYLTSEICFETVARWRIALAERWSEEWDRFSIDFKTDELEKNIDPMVSYEGETITTGTQNGKMESSADTHGKTKDEARNRHSETPQGSLEDVENGKYLTTYDYNNGTSENEQETLNKTQSETSNDSVTKTRGTSISYAALLEQYRKTSHSDVKDFLNALGDLFLDIF